VRAIGYGIENKDRSRPPAYVFAHYDTDNYSSSVRYDDKYLAMTQQQFSAMLKTVEIAFNSEGVIKTGCEIGCSSGDLSHYLAQKYPQTAFRGIDFSVKHTPDVVLKNLTYSGGYILDNTDWLDCDLLFAVSTFTLMLPKEFDALLATCAEKGVRFIAISEPWWWHFPAKNDSETPYSVNMKFIAWGHDYLGYLRKHGYSIKHFELEPSPSDPNVERYSVLAALEQA